jgi:hypothetical protein
MAQDRAVHQPVVVERQHSRIDVHDEVEFVAESLDGVGVAVTVEPMR